MLFFGVLLREVARTAAKSRTNLSIATGPIGAEVTPPSVFHGHHFTETLQVVIISGSSPEISQTVRINCRSSLSRVRISVRPSKLYLGETPKNRPKIDWSIIVSARARTATGIRNPLVLCSAPVSAIRVRFSWRLAILFYFTHYYCLRLTTLTFNRSVSLRSGRSRVIRLVE